MAEAKNKFYQVKKTIGGVEYTAQFNGLSYALKTVDDSYIDDSSNISSEKFAQTILSDVIVDPHGLTPDDFDTMDNLNEVVRFGREVMQGKFRDKK